MVTLELTNLVNEGWLPLHRRIMEEPAELLGILLPAKRGLEPAESHRVAGDGCPRRGREYTIVMDGLNPSDCLTGMENLGIEIFNFGSFPFTIEVQRGLLEEIVEKQDELFDDPVGGILKYLPGLAIRFG